MEDKDKQALPPVDPLENLKRLFYFLVEDVLRAFPVLVGILTFIFFAILALLFFIFQGGNIISP